MSMSFMVSGSRFSGFQWFRPLPGLVSPSSPVWLRFCREWSAGAVGLVCPACGSRLRVCCGSSVFCSGAAAPLPLLPSLRAVWSGCCPGCGAVFLPAL